MDRRGIGCEGLEWIRLAADKFSIAVCCELPGCRMCILFFFIVGSLRRLTQCWEAVPCAVGCTLVLTGADRCHSLRSGLMTVSPAR